MTFRARTSHAVAAAVLLGVALRLPFLADPLKPDEAGYLLVARQWHLFDPKLYGRLWVDRPPLLLLLFQVADSWGPYGIRLLGVAAVALLSTAAGVAGALLRGREGAITASLVAGTLASSYAIGGEEVDGELLGVPLVMLCCALTMLALRLPRFGLGVGALAGVTGTSALLVKQNLADGLVFAIFLLVATLVVARRNAAPAGRPAPSAVRVLAGGIVGTMAVVATVLGWAWGSGVGLEQLGYALYGFRAHADAVIGSVDASRPLQRAAVLAGVALISGIVALLVILGRHATPRLRRGDPVAAALAGMALYGVISVVAGGSYWVHYLVELVPVLALGAAVAGARRVALGVVAAAVVATGVGAALNARPGEPEMTATTIGRFLRGSARPGDGVVVTYGHANLVEESRLATPYPYLWSLPLRVRDPSLDRLVTLLRGGRPPTWIVEWDDFNAWGIDASGRLAATVTTRYHPVATVCGHRVWLRDGRTRPHSTRALEACSASWD
jgi:hypothetical protein